MVYSPDEANLVERQDDDRIHGCGQWQGGPGGASRGGERQAGLTGG